MFFSGLAIGFSLVSGCLVLAAVAELYYLLWWKKRKAEDESDHSNYAKELLLRMCWIKPASLAEGSVKEESETKGVQPEPDLEVGTGKDGLLKTSGEEGVESELSRLHNLGGPPRFLFTIKEETKEDLESEDGKSRGDLSESDLMLAIDTPLFLNVVDSYKHLGFNPLFESSTELELNGFRYSPPPKLKFLRDAEDKLYRRLIEEELKNHIHGSGSVEESPNSTMVTQDRPQFHSSCSSSQASSPTTFIVRPLENGDMVCLQFKRQTNISCN